MKPKTKEVISIAEHQEKDWLAKLKPEEWFIEEYKLLSSHYFHEDSQIQQTTAIYATLNGGLLAFLGSNFASDQGTAKLFVPFIGVILCLSWAATLIRIRECRLYIEKRIRKIEETLNEFWQRGGLIPLDLRIERDWAAWKTKTTWYNWPYLLFRDQPSSLVLLTLPVAFLGIWVVLIVIRLSVTVLAGKIRF